MSDSSARALNAFFRIAAVVFSLLTFSFHLRDDGRLWILWRDQTMLAATLFATAMLMVVGWFYTSRFLRREQNIVPSPTAALKAPYNIFGPMEPAVRRRMALAVFLTFAIIGPISILMQSPSTPLHPLTVAIITIASGAMGASFIIFGERKILLVVSFLLFQAATMSAHEITEFLVGHGASVQTTAALNAAPALQAEVGAQRKLIGVLGIALLAAGYTMWIVVLNKEGSKRARYQAELQIAQSIQQRLLPSDVVHTERCEAWGRTVPTAEVGGDYFDFVTFADSRLAAVVADVSGHGIGAGIISTMTKSALRTQLMHDPAPVAMLENINAVLHQVSDRKTFVTVAYVLLDASGAARIATAGHPPVLACSPDGAIRELRTQSLGLGMQLRARFNEVHCTLRADDLLVLYTDGVLEAANDAGEQFGLERLKHAIASAMRLDVQQAAGTIIAAVQEFTGKKQFPDDATVVVIRKL